ncbi:hypothetical protein KIW84_011998 [Lathyrus oleraceus]|uniref:Uncharacterized protein n=1 Tax=Pisum sativum TaxID=3888 RepID=A0A9D5BGJ2_PEA|nr:hypothetical protein KIW84_011998 [Pisum sativum]
MNEGVSQYSEPPPFFSMEEVSSNSSLLSLSSHFWSNILLDYCTQSRDSTLLDVFPIKDIGLSKDVREKVELLLKQSRRAKLLIDMGDDALRIRLFSIGDTGCCRGEIEALEEQIVNHGGDIEPTITVLKGLVAMTRYCRFLIFGFEEDELDLENGNQTKPEMGLITQEIAETCLTVLKDFCGMISLNLMRNPGIILTGQTYD